MLCVVGRWLENRPKEIQDSIKYASEKITRVALLDLCVDENNGDAPFSLTALKDHFLANCVCGREDTKPVVESVGNSYTVAVNGPRSIEEVLRECRIDPDKYEVVGEVAVRSRELQSGEIVYTYSLKVRERTKTVDVAWLADRVKQAAPAEPVLHDSDTWFVFQAGDLQLGKWSSGGSTDEILERYWLSVERALGRLRFVRDEYVQGGVAGVQLCFPGDCLEGSQSQRGANVWLTQETITEQTRIFRRLLMTTIERFAPEAPYVYVDVVNGNHDQAERRWNTYPGDGWATECALSVKDALTLNEDAYGHVEVRVPDQWSGSMTVPVGDTMVTVAHGHQWPRNKGMTWWAEQALHNQAAKDSQVLQHGHIHTWELEAARDRIRVSSPTFDCGSDWFREKHGGESKRGALTYLLAGGEVLEMSLV